MNSKIFHPWILRCQTPSAPHGRCRWAWEVQPLTRAAEQLRAVKRSLREAWRVLGKSLFQGPHWQALITHQQVLELDTSSVMGGATPCTLTSLLSQKLCIQPYLGNLSKYPPSDSDPYPYTGHICIYIYNIHTGKSRKSLII